MNLRDAAHHYAQTLGWPVFPLAIQGKEPVTTSGFKDATKDLGQIGRWWSRDARNIGVPTGQACGFIVMDVDGAEGAATLERLEAKHGEIVTRRARTGGGGQHLLFVWPGIEVRNRAKLLPGIDIRGDGGYIVVAPSVHPSGVTYEWLNDDAIAEMPGWLLNILFDDAARDAELGVAPIEPPTSSTNSAGMTKPTTRYAEAALRRELDIVRGAPEGTRNDTLNRSVFAIAAFVRDGLLDAGTVEREFAAAASAAGLVDKEIVKTVHSALSGGIDRSRRVIAPGASGTNGTNGYHANGMNGTQASTQTKAAPAPAGKKPPTPTDDEIAERWLAEHPGTRYGLGEFRRYVNGIWPALTTEQVDGELADVLQRAKPEGIRPTSGRMESVRVMARALTAKHVSEWDANPDLLACGNGTLEISTMTLRPHREGDFLTSGVSFDYDPAAEAHTFEWVLNATVPEAAAFIQEFAGYSLTTDTKYELCLWFAGPPGSGKSTIIEGLRAMLGSRCGLLGLADIERNTFALSNVPGKTLLISTEQPHTFMQATHILNQLVSGEMLSVNRKYRDPIEIIPRAKLAWAMNDLPRVGDANDGLFRRVKIVRFPKLNTPPDPTVKECVKAEGAGVLNWALAGLRRLRDRGRFEIPASVSEAVEQFQKTNDVPSLFVAECCVTGIDKEVSATSLYEAYKSWCIDTGHKPQSSTSLAQDWKRLGFERKHGRNGTVWEGIGLLVNDITLKG